VTARVAWKRGSSSAAAKSEESGKSIKGDTSGGNFL